MKKAAVKYPKPYNTRYTLISHALEGGMNPILVAELTGHDVKTLYENYAGCIEPLTPTSRFSQSIKYKLPPKNRDHYYQYAIAYKPKTGKNF